MLQNLHVKNLALIDEVEVDFSNGLNIMTGETGAGKSIVLGSVNLALGGRYSADMLRKGADAGLVELTFAIDNPLVEKKLKGMDIEPEDGQLIISRRLMEGRSICRINGETVTVGQLKEVAAILIDIHGQHEHQSLLYKKNHLTILDAYAKNGEQAKAKVKELYQSYRKLCKEYDQMSGDEADRLKEIAFLEFEINEIQNAGISEREIQELEHSYRTMLKGKKMAENLQEAYAYTSDQSVNAGDLISRAVRSLADISGEDKTVSGLYEEISEIESLITDFSRELRDYIDEISFSEEAFYETESRLNEIHHLQSKYGDTAEEIFAYLNKKEERLQVLKNYDIYMAELRNKMEAEKKKLSTACKTLSKIRKQEAKELQEKIVEGLKDLNFLDVKFEISFKELEQYTSDGMDDVEFMISMNPGQPVRPLCEIASGGELSRIMLALKAELAEKDEIDTLIFDEIDVGISGRTAQKVSEKMALIGKRHQVICITHLAQIAAMADSHYLIEKEVVGQDTRTSICKLDKEKETLELARILSGAQITETVLESAKEMKKLAEELKK